MWEKFHHMKRRLDFRLSKQLKNQISHTSSCKTYTITFKGYIEWMIEQNASPHHF